MKNDSAALNKPLTKDEAQFLEKINDPVNRPILLARLEQLGLLSAFLAAENETT